MGEQLAHDDVGAGDPIVFLHGITANRHHWGPVVERLRGSHRCINVDLLGHGDSPDGPTVDLFAQVGALLQLLESLDLRRPVLVGHSYGGFIATFAATAGTVRGVVNVDQTFDTGAFRTLIEPLADELRSDRFATTFERFLATQRPDLVPAPHQELLHANMRPRQEVVMDVWGAVLDAPAEELADQVEAVLPSVAAPYLGLFGAPLSAEEQRLQSLIPQGEVEIWDGSGHFLHLVDPDRMAARIAAFLATLP